VRWAKGALEQDCVRERRCALDLFGDDGGRTVSGRLDAIWIKRMKRGPMDSVEHAMLKRNAGLVGNANQGGRRQVTIMEREAWDRLMSEVKGSVPLPLAAPIY